MAQLEEVSSSPKSLEFIVWELHMPPPIFTPTDPIIFERFKSGPKCWMQWHCNVQLLAGLEKSIRKCARKSSNLRHRIKHLLIGLKPKTFCFCWTCLKAIYSSDPHHASGVSPAESLQDESLHEMTMIDIQLLALVLLYFVLSGVHYFKSFKIFSASANYRERNRSGGMTVVD